MKGNRRRYFIHCVSAICIIIFLTMTISIGEHAAWDCPECGRTGNTGNYCGGCGHTSPWIAGGVSENSNDAETTVQEENLKPYKTIGNYVTFGTYPQTKEGTDQTPIEWLVLDYDETNNKALLLSRYGLDVQPYNTTNVGGITWEKCTLRQWMNTTFLSTAFSGAEQSEILLTEVDNSSNQGYSGWDTWGGNDTQDRLFLLSYAEANHYFTADYKTSSIRSRVAPSTYAKKQGAGTVYYCKTEDEDAAGGWWLRSPGYFGNSAAIVHYDGSIDSDNICIGYRCVRPALWINLESDIFTHSSTAKDEEKNIKIGDTIPFGHYEQDNNIENGPEEIKWIVLDIQEGKALLHSKFILDAMAFDESSSAYWWENCSLRSWLNLDFLNTAFSSEERDMILMTEVANDASQRPRVYGEISGATTNDRVFLLSYHEVYDLYYPDEEIRKKVSTDYAQTGRYLGFSPWWLRTSWNDRCADYIGCNGKSGSTYKSMTYIGVIPALWIKLQMN